jgi:cell division protein FtsL
MKKYFWSLNKVILGVGLAIFIFLVSIAIFNKKGILRAIDLNSKITNIKNNITMLENENRMLVEAIRSYKSENIQIEKIAREDLGLAKENEIIIKIIK